MEIEQLLETLKRTKNAEERLVLLENIKELSILKAKHEIKQKEFEMIRKLKQLEQFHEKFMASESQKSIEKTKSFFEEVLKKYLESSGIKGASYVPYALQSISQCFQSQVTRRPSMSTAVKPKEIGIPSDSTSPRHRARQEAIEEAKNSDKELSDRIIEAQAQGFRWNDTNTPPKVSTQYLKIKEWEDAYAEGLNSDLSVTAKREPLDPRKIPDKAFMTGACVAFEDRLGHKAPCHPYLVPRFKLLQKEYLDKQEA